MDATIKQQCDTIISMQTMPPQIDFISHTQRAKHLKAEKFINDLPSKKRKEANDYIRKQVEEYYEESIVGEDGQMYSIASLDAMF